MSETGRDAVDTICDLLLSEDLGVGPGHERAVVGDAAAVRGAPGRHGRHGLHVPRRQAGAPHVRFVPRILGQFVRDEARLSLEEAIRKMTGAAAARLGLRHRGRAPRRRLRRHRRVRPGNGPLERHVRRTAPFPDGIEHVLVNGMVVVDGGEHTGASPGRGIRVGRD